MNLALTMHDQIMRFLLTKFRGYEVKTEGDAFMVTFFSAADALRWCIAVQEHLLSVEWPAKLLLQEAAKKEPDAKGQLIFNGLRVRMGIHIGQPIHRRNPTTKRMDYFGPVVNMSARISDTAHGGQIVCSLQAVDALKDEKKTFEKRQAEKKLNAKPEETKKKEEPKKLELKSMEKTVQLDAAAQKEQMEKEKALNMFPEFTAHEMGKYNLKGISEPIPIFQLIPPKLAARKFPPLRVETTDEEPPEHEEQPGA
jgi:adenylate cyclase